MRSWYAILPWSDYDHEFNLETETSFRGDTVMLEVSRIHENVDTMDDEGWYFTSGYTYQFKLLAYNELVENYEIEIQDTMTDDENIAMQKEIDERAADLAADEAERRYER